MTLVMKHDIVSALHLVLETGYKNKEKRKRKLICVILI